MHQQMMCTGRIDAVLIDAVLDVVEDAVPDAMPGAADEESTHA